MLSSLLQRITSGVDGSGEECTQADGLIIGVKTVESPSDLGSEIPRALLAMLEHLTSKSACNKECMRAGTSP